MCVVEFFCMCILTFSYNWWNTSDEIECAQFANISTQYLIWRHSFYVFSSHNTCVVFISKVGFWFVTLCEIYRVFLAKAHSIYLIYCWILFSIHTCGLSMFGMYFIVVWKLHLAFYNYKCNTNIPPTFLSRFENCKSVFHILTCCKTRCNYPGPRMICLTFGSGRHCLPKW